MGVFRRGKRSGEDPEVADDLGTSTEADVTTTRERGPWDVSEVPERGRRIDLGALWLPGRDGMELRMEIEKTSKIVSAAAVSLRGSALQLQVFAAPRTEGVWDDIRAEIAESVVKQGGSVDDVPGPFGRELLARLPVRTAEGRTGHRPARFIGHDGPRWFLRGVVTGRAAVEPQEAGDLEDVFADVVVVRGSEPRVPRDLLPLTMPGRRAPAVPAVPGAVTAPPLDPLTRGPEITEVH
ncbi:DUF3710 domain-containing protein [Actinotalea ferrariae]|uniref:DUF3710 domain-containing protein n=1 Tax=Actinotalea ferrariae TaxID=1386098 RepID=UPI001C8B3B6A|nr:DUF3710 domain-containing protein [Actinotalea ferrariae]MBX9244765.1 DUF3710 domain-containing protein [Actinotalea ferrariae]